MTFFSLILLSKLILEHFWYNSEPQRYIWFQEMLMKYGGMLCQDFFRETA